MPDTLDDTLLLARAEVLLLDPHRCPVCTTPLGGPVCARCGMDLSGPAGAELWAASGRAAAAIRHRLDLAHESWRAQTGAAPWGPFPATTPDLGPVQPPYPVAPPTPSAPRSGTPAPARPPRRWRVQHVLLGLGAALLATASIVFLVFSWRVLSLPVRTVLVGTGTVVVFALASVLRRRALRQSAEAVGCLGVVLLLLDTWAVRATGLVGDVEGSIYAATASVLCAAVLVAWGRVSGVRAGSVAAAVLLPVAPVLLAARATTAAQAGGLLLLAVLVSFARYAVARTHRAERAVLGAAAAVASAATGAAALVATVAHGADHAPAAGAALFLALAATSLVHAWCGARDRPADAVTSTLTDTLADTAADDAVRATGLGAWAAASGLALAAAGAAALTPTAVPAAVGATTGAGLLAVLGPVALRGRTRWLGALGAATRAATGLTLVLLVPVLLLVLRDLGHGLLTPEAAGRATGTAAVLRLGALLAAAGSLLLAARARALPATVAGHTAAALTSTAVLAGAVLAGTRLDDAHGATVTLVAVGCASLVAQGTTLHGDSCGTRVARTHLRAGAVVAVLLALVAAVGTPWTSALACAALSGTGVTARRWSADRVLQAFLAAASAAAGWVALGCTLLAAGTGTAVAVAVAGAVGVAVLAVTVVELDPVVGPTRSALLATGAAGGVVSWTGALAAMPAGTTGGAHDAAAVSTLVLAATLVAAAVLVTLRGAHRLPVVAVVAAAAGAPTCTALGLWSAHALLGTPSAGGTALACLGVGVATALAAPSLRIRDSDVAVATAAETAAWVVVGGAVATAAVVDAQLTALTLLVAAAAVAASAARGPRSGRLWVSLALAVASSWTSFGDLGVETPEAYTAPLGLVLVAVAVRWWRRAGSGADLLGAGLALVTLPTAVAPGAVTLARWEVPRVALTTVLAAAVVAVALLVARRTTRPTAPGPWSSAVPAPLLVLLAAAAALTLLGPVRRALTLAGGTWTHGSPTGRTWAGTGVVPVLLWSLATLVLVAGASAAARAAWPAARRHAVHLASGWTLLATVAVPVLTVRTGGPRGAGPVLLAFALGTWLGVRSGGRGGQATAQAVTLLVGATVSALVQPWSVPSDVPLVVLGAALCVTGLPRLLHDRTARSWPALGAGLVLALAVPLLWSLPDPQSWRTLLVLLGGLAAVQVGVTRRWRAPFVVGGLVLAAEAIVQVSPVATRVVDGLGWWPVLGLSGVALLGLGLTYERRLRDARTALQWVAQLR